MYVCGMVSCAPTAGCQPTNIFNEVVQIVLVNL
jgi:hypothetical protein